MGRIRINYSFEWSGTNATTASEWAYGQCNICRGRSSKYDVLTIFFRMFLLDYLANIVLWTNHNIVLHQHPVTTSEDYSKFFGIMILITRISVQWKAWDLENGKRSWIHVCPKLRKNYVFKKIWDNHNVHLLKLSATWARSHDIWSLQVTTMWGFSHRH